MEKYPWLFTKPPRPQTPSPEIKPKTTVQDILMALFLGKFTPGTEVDGYAFAGCEGNLWIWHPPDHENEMVTIDDNLGGMRVELHCYLEEHPEDSGGFFVNLVTGKIEHA